MAWTTPGTATAGNVLTAAFWNTQVRDNMVELAPLTAAWTSFTPTLWQGAATPNINKTVLYSKYLKVGKLVVVSVNVTATGAGTAGQAIQIRDIPAAAAAANQSGMIGSFTYFDSGNTNITGTVYGLSTTSVGLQADRDNSPVGIVPNFAVANNDNLSLTLTYEAA